MTTIMALGCVVSLAGVTGVFAAFTDRATTGVNTFETAELARAADLKLSTGDPVLEGGFACGAFEDDLDTGVMTVGDNLPTYSRDSDFVCLHNAGSGTVDITTSVIDVIDFEEECSGDEGAVDPSCGDDLPGELSERLNVAQSRLSCADQSFLSLAGPVSFDSMVGTPLASFSLAPGETACLLFHVSYDPADLDQATVSQSDAVTWRFAFDGTTA
jgi:predicted ribosomally synthesized peptide with SipW-like signal peptide